MYLSGPKSWNMVPSDEFLLFDQLCMRIFLRLNGFGTEVKETSFFANVLL